MIDRDAKPIESEHRSPYKRIDLYGPKAEAPRPGAIASALDEHEQNKRRIEGERIWKLVRQCAEGTSAPASGDLHER